jgi:hypothetical protein
MCPAKIKYTRKQKEDVYNLYWEGRTRKNQRIDVYSRAYISKVTGVNINSVWKIANLLF